MGIAMTEIDAFSLTTVPVQQFANGEPIEKRHGLCVEARPAALSHHELARRDREGRQDGRARNAGPSGMLRCLFNVRVGTFGKQQWDITIRDDTGCPHWLINPGGGRAIDVVALPIPMTGNEPAMDMYPINTLLSKTANQHRNGRVCPRISIRCRSPRVPCMEARQHHVRAGSCSHDYRILLDRHRLPSRHVGGLLSFSRTGPTISSLVAYAPSTTGPLRI